MAAIAVTDTDWDSQVLKAELPVLVDFWAEWCGSCRRLMPLVNEIAVDEAERVKVVKVEVDANPAIAEAAGVMSVPTLVVYRNGQVVERISGAADKATMLRALGIGA